MSVDAWVTVGIAAATGILSAGATVAVTAWTLSGSLLRKKDFDATIALLRKDSDATIALLRQDQRDHEKKDDERWGDQTEESKKVLAGLSNIQGLLEGEGRRSRPR